MARSCKASFIATRLWLLAPSMPLLVAGLALASASQSNTFSLSDGARITVPPLWSERKGAEVPPPRILQTSAPKVQFSEILALENRESHAILKVALSNNPFVGRNAPSLDTQMHQPDELARHLFYFFFPPPPNCLTQAEVRYRQEVSRKEAEQVGEEASKESKRPEKSVRPPDIRVDQPCRFGPTLADLFSEQVATGVVYRRTKNVENVSGNLRPFSLPPMEEIEINGLTIFVFEAQAVNFIDREEIDRYGLPESLRGTRPYFFYAIAAPAPFPFLDDPSRKEVTVIHVAYATLTLSGDARDSFKALLRTLHRN